MSRRSMGRFLAGVAIVAAMAGTSPATAETLSDALVSAYRNSDLLEQNRALLRARDEGLAQAVAALRPVISFTADAGYSVLRNDGVTLNDDTTARLRLTSELAIYDGGNRRLGVEAANELVLATRAALVGVEQAVLLTAVQSFVDVRTATQTVALRESNVGVIEQQLRAAQDRFALGEVTRTDVAIAEARLAGARSALASASGDLAIARESYRLAVGAYPGALGAPADLAAPAPTLEGAIAIARTRQPTLVQARHLLAASEINVARAKAQMGPQLGVGGSVGIADTGAQSGSVQLSFSQPLYQGGTLSARLRAAIAQRDQDAAALHRAAAEIDRNVAQAWARLEVARASIAASEQQVAASQAAFESVSEEAQFGARTTLDVLNAEQELRDAETARLAAVAAQQKSAYGLLAAMGLLTVTDLRLGVPVYDVSAYHDAVRSAPVSPEGARLDRILSVLGEKE